MGTWLGIPGINRLKIINALGSLFPGLVVKQEETSEDIATFNNAADTIVARVRYDGRVQVATPTATTDATTKAYVDAADAITPAHATSHQSGGSDAIKLDDFAAPDDNTDLNASTTAHGLLRKLDNTATHYLDGQGGWTTPSGTSTWTRVYQNIVGSAVTSATISGLAGNTDHIYMVFAYFVGGHSSGSCDYTLRPNNDSTAANYASQYVSGNGATAGAARTTSDQGFYIGTCANTLCRSFVQSTIFAKSGFARVANSLIHHNFRDSTASLANVVLSQGHIWFNTADEITSMVITASQTSGIGVGSHIEVWATR